MTMGCEEVRTSLGVYVVGAIDPAERAQVDAHLGDCSRCRDELAGMAGLPALLGRVSEQQLSELAGPPEELLETMLARAAPGRWNRWSRMWPMLAAAAVLALVIGGVFGGVLFRQGDSGRSAAPTVTVTATPSRPPGEKLTASDPATGISATLTVRKAASGTYVELHLKDVKQGLRCRLNAVARNGRRDSMGSWEVARKGYHGFYGSTMLPRGEVTSFEVVTAEGKTLLTIPA
jgi:predicted anti-sigma-YlaC factor YlaD